MDSDTSHPSLPTLSLAGANKDLHALPVHPAKSGVKPPALPRTKQQSFWVQVEKPQCPPESFPRCRQETELGISAASQAAVNELFFFLVLLLAAPTIPPLRV